MRIIALMAVALLISLCGCKTYLGKEKVNLKPLDPKFEKIDSELKSTHWQYNIADGKLTLTNSSVSDITYDKFVDHPYFFREKYIDFPLERFCFTADFALKNTKGRNKEIVAWFHVLNPGAWFMAIGDMCRWAWRWIGYPIDATNENWHLEKEYGPGLLYRIAYLPVIANCNPFMLPPYIDSKYYAQNHMYYQNSKTYTETKQSVYITERESGIESGKRRFLYVNGKEIKLENMPGGKYTVNLRDSKLVPRMLPPRDIKLTVKDNRKTVIDLTIKTTAVIDGEHLYLWNLLNDKKVDYRTRFIALHKLYDLKLINNNDFADIKKNILAE
ncbi:MAG: hypothetical protein IJW08_10370 [Lentisphaeria bacterium]|nr:hypothetical protein [Lentisphaeria bacterium]MBQ7396931.1 hypothetical protein [Lentisphaeria bacterium]